MLAQHVGVAKFRIVRDVLDRDRRAGLHRAAGRGKPVGAKADMPDHAGLPADAGLDQEIAPIGAIAQDLNMLDVGDAGNLGGGVLQQARDGGRFIDNAREDASAR